MIDQPSGEALSPLLKASVAFGWVGGLTFLVIAIVLSARRRRFHPLLIVCISAMSISWIEAPYDWAMYAQFPPELPRMPSWWPVNMTWGGGLPSSVPAGYMSYFAVPAVTGAFLGRRLSARYGWRRPQTLLGTGLVVGFCWALVFNAGLGAQLGVFYYGRVIPGLAIREGTIHQYPLYDALAMGVQMMVFTYLLGRVDEQGRNVIDQWADRRSATRRQSYAWSIAAAVVVGHAVYGAVFLPHLVTKLRGDVTAESGEQLFDGVPNQPLHGS